MASETPFYQKVILWSALAVTLVAALLVEDESEELWEEEVVQPARVSGGQRQHSKHEQAGELLPIDQLGKRQFSATAHDIFAVTSWEPEQIVAIDTDTHEQDFQAIEQEEIAWQPLLPAAPPLQFEYLGKVISQGRVRVFLAQGDENYAVGVGERIRTEYRVERILNNAVELTYLPLGVRQILTIE